MSGQYVRRFRRCLWAVVFTFALGALAPLVSQLLSTRDALQWQEICTAAGMVRIAIADDADGAPQPAPAFHYCPYCVMHGGDNHLPPADARGWSAPLLAQTLRLALPALDYRPDKFPLAAILLLLRAPPALS